MPRRVLLLLALVLPALAAAACSGQAAVDAPAYWAFRDQPTACGAATPSPAKALQFDGPGDAGTTGPVTAVLHTSCGAVTLRLDPALAPETVNSFVFLAQEGYFDGTVVHRVVPGFVMQAGDPEADGTGGPGYYLPDEFPPVDFTFTRGTVAMANGGTPESGGSQFFIVLADIGLPPYYSVFGEVTAGWDVLDRIAALPMAPNPPDPVDSKPLETIYLETVEILGG